MTTTRTTHQNTQSSKPFTEAINTRLNSPLTTLFRLAIRVLQLLLALAAGISHAVELSHGATASPFIYSQVVFGLTLITLLLDALTIRTYKLIFLVEFVLCILWLALFGVFYSIYFRPLREIKPAYANVDFGRVKRTVWLDLVNFLLWVASAAFASAMCCAGTRAAIRRKWDGRKMKKGKGKGIGEEAGMESGVVREGSSVENEDRLPMYELIAKTAQNGRL
ncbi:hypothetical protein CC80DRAFT_487094 [Byssothecium circinans]|uniref:MARVEL domain-containing protein n=1 Tax=Byssothecium circinans TaxID=147558 RepID=A0A6A5URR8_9PLEO|nr:hypothetical protein CC80DRAFT_487094 [Byssothecium circinans]